MTPKVSGISLFAPYRVSYNKSLFLSLEIIMEVHDPKNLYNAVLAWVLNKLFNLIRAED